MKKERKEKSKKGRKKVRKPEEGGKEGIQRTLRMPVCTNRESGNLQAISTATISDVSPPEDMTNGSSGDRL